MSFTDAPEVTVTIAGDRWDAWTRLDVTLSLEELAPRFTLEAFDIRERDDEIFPFGEGDPCSIDVQLPGQQTSERVLTGYLGRVEMSDGPDDGDVRVMVTGAPKSVDLLECGTPPRAWSKCSILKIANDICEPFGLRVSTKLTGEVLEPVERFEVDPGDSPGAVIQRLCELRGVIATTLDDGTIALVESESRSSGLRLECPGNIIRGTATGDYSDRFSSYTIFSQRTPQKKFAGAVAAGMAVEIRDDQVRRFRPFLDVSHRDEKQAQLESRAKFVRNVQAGRSRVYGCELDGWGDQRGKLWRPNVLASVQHRRVGIDDELLISRVVLQGDARQGFTTYLDLARRETFDRLAEPANKGRGRRSRY